MTSLIFGLSKVDRIVEVAIGTLDFHFDLSDIDHRSCLSVSSVDLAVDGIPGWKASKSDTRAFRLPMQFRWKFWTNRGQRHCSEPLSYLPCAQPRRGY